MVIGLDIMTQCFWEGLIGILLKSPQQIVLGHIKDHIYTGVPGTMVDLTHLLGYIIMIHRAGSSFHDLSLSIFCCCILTFVVVGTYSFK
jgi:hypothetical protein